MKVMYLIWSLGVGGAEKMVLSLARGHGGHVEPLVCCLDGPGSEARLLEEAGVKVIALNKRRGFDPFVIGRLRRIVREERVDLINSHLWSANLYGRLLRFFCDVPLVTVEHNVDLWKSRLHFTIDSLLAPRSDHYIFVSSAVRDFYSRNVPAALRRHCVVYNGIDLNPIRSAKNLRSEILAHFGAGSSAKLLVNVGRLVEAKNQEELIRCTRLLVERGHDVYTVIAGDGPLRETLAGAVEAQGMQKRVWLMGRREDTASIMHSCDLFVLPSRWEGLPLVILETICAGTPPVFYDVGGTSEVARDGMDGVRIPSGDLDSLVSEIDRLLSDGSEIGRLRRNAAERGIDSFGAANMVRAYETLFSGICSLGGARP